MLWSTANGEHSGHAMSCHVMNNGKLWQKA